jgi:REP element-mobilizing transposase RayT
MPSTHTSLHFHLIFSTKNRYPLIAKDWQDRLHAYLGGLVRPLGGVPDEINGTADHVHLLVGLRPTHCLAEVLQDVKSSSSKWVHDEIGSSKFAWQAGYGGFTVSPSQMEAVRKYIREQESHHRKKTFQQEYLELLDRSGIEYDKRYLW